MGTMYFASGCKYFTDLWLIFSCILRVGAVLKGSFPEGGLLLEGSSPKGGELTSLSFMSVPRQDEIMRQAHAVNMRLGEISVRGRLSGWLAGWLNAHIKAKV